MAHVWQKHFSVAGLFRPLSSLLLTGGVVGQSSSRVEMVLKLCLDPFGLSSNILPDVTILPATHG